MSILPRLVLALLAATCLTLPAAAQGGIALHDLFQDGMVIQRDSAVTVRGTAVEVGPTVTVRAGWPGGGEHVVEVGPDSRFAVTIPTGEAGGPFLLEVVGGPALAEVWLGEVWLCSGQSNMEWPLSASAPGSATLAASSDAPADWNQPGIRLLEIPHRTASSPVDGFDARWTPCTPESARSFSAVALHFASVLHQELGVPIGLIGSHWGGTPAEAWTREESLGGFPGLQGGLERLRGHRADAASRGGELPAAVRAWLEALDAAGVGPGSTPPAEGWTPVSMPQHWEQHAGAGLESFDGLVWYRREVGVPQDWVGKPVELSLGPIDDFDVTTIDGQRFVSWEAGSFHKPRVYRWVPAGTVTTLVVRALDTGGAGGFGGAAEQLSMHPVGRPEVAVPLTEGWEMLRGPALGDLPAVPTSGGINQNTPAALYNGMIAPLVGFPIAGAIWYQGESNRGRFEEYRTLFPTMISDWRDAWGYDFPFYYVQIAPFGYGGDTGQAAELREAQRLAMRLPRTGMAVTMDIGNPADIHPRNKHAVGRRLALWAMAGTYGRTDLVHSGPLPTQPARAGAGVQVRFEHTGGGLVAPGGLTLFEACGANGVWHPASAEISGDHTVLVRCPEAGAIEQVRYAWGAADAAELFNAEGLPASSFRISL